MNQLQHIIDAGQPSSRLKLMKTKSKMKMNLHLHLLSKGAAVFFAASSSLSLPSVSAAEAAVEAASSDDLQPTRRQSSNSYAYASNHRALMRDDEQPPASEEELDVASIIDVMETGGPLSYQAMEEVEATEDMMIMAEVAEEEEVEEEEDMMIMAEIVEGNVAYGQNDMLWNGLGYSNIDDPPINFNNGPASSSFEDGKGFSFVGRTGGACSQYAQYFLGNYGALKATNGSAAPNKFKGEGSPPTWYDSRVQNCSDENGLRIYDGTCVVSEGNPLGPDLGGTCKTNVNFHQCPRYAKDYEQSITKPLRVDNNKKCTIASKETGNEGACVGEASSGTLSLSGTAKVTVCCKGYNEHPNMFLGAYPAYFGVVPPPGEDSKDGRGAACKGGTCDYHVQCACPDYEPYNSGGGVLFAPGEATGHTFSVPNDGKVANEGASIVLAPEANKDFYFREVFFGAPDSGTYNKNAQISYPEMEMKVGEPLDGITKDVQIVVKGPTCDVSSQRGSIGIGNAGQIVNTCEGSNDCTFDEGTTCIEKLRKQIMSMGEAYSNGQKIKTWPLFRDESNRPEKGLTRRLGIERSLKAKASKVSRTSKSSKGSCYANY